MKSRSLTIAGLLCVMMLPISVIAQTTSSTAARRQQALIKRINQGAQRFYKEVLRHSVRAPATIDCDLNDLLEDLLLAVDGLSDTTYRQHNLVIVMQIASDIEQELLRMDISTNVVTAWSRLHADVDQLAKMNGIKWSVAVITSELIATLTSDVDTISKTVLTEFSPFHSVSLTTSTDLPLLLSNFRSSAQELSNSSIDKLRLRIEALRTYARAITTFLNNHVVSTALQRDWRRVTSRLEELVRLYLLDSSELA